MGKSILDGLRDNRPAEKTGGGAPGQFFCGDIDMRIARDGTWYYLGSPIGRQAMVKLFAKVLRRDADGDFWLETPVEKCRIQVEDAPFVAVEMTVTGTAGEQKLEFRTNVDEIVIAGPDHPIRVETDSATGEPSPYIMIRDGLEALIARAVFYDLVELAEQRSVDGECVLVVCSDDAQFALGALD